MKEVSPFLKIKLNFPIELTAQDAFRVMDKDFDGELSKKDLELFLLNELKYYPEEISENKIDRLYKLMDTYKRDCIQLTDLKKLICS